LRIAIEIDNAKSPQREVTVGIAAEELLSVVLHLAFPDKRNRTGFYMRRHPARSDASSGARVGPNTPLRSEEEPPKKPIREHLREMREKNQIPYEALPSLSAAKTFSSEPVMLAVPISDLVANLLRPCFHRDGLGEYRVFHFDAEPIHGRTYWCACFFEQEYEAGRLEFRQVRFDPETDRALDVSGRDLFDEGLAWAAAVVPLVVDGRPLTPVEIAQNDYDLRHIVGRRNERPIRYAYEGWFDDWDKRVEEIVLQHMKASKPFETYYHSVLGLDRYGNIHVRQQEAVLPDLATQLRQEGIIAAGLLDSGGSCALYDVWMASYLNHGWYYREPRGAIIVFELRSSQRIPQDAPGLWIRRREED